MWLLAAGGIAKRSSETCQLCLPVSWQGVEAIHYGLFSCPVVVAVIDFCRS